MKVHAIEHCVDGCAYEVLEIYKDKKKAEERIKFLENKARKHDRFLNLSLVGYNLR